MIRKQTAIWKTKDGRKVRICDMTDDHLKNTIALLERTVTQMRHEFLAAGNPFREGTMAEEMFDDAQYIEMEEPTDPTEVYPILDNLYAEQRRREDIVKFNHLYYSSTLSFAACCRRYGMSDALGRKYLKPKPKDL